MMLKHLANSDSVKGMKVTDVTLTGICEDCISGKMDEKPFEHREDQDANLFGMLHADLIGPMSPKARWTCARFCLVVNDDYSGFGFTFNLKHKSNIAEAIISLDKTIEVKSRNGYIH